MGRSVTTAAKMSETKTASLESKYFKVGRVVYCAYGKQAGKLAVITDVIDHNRVVIDGPFDGIIRQDYDIKRLRLTKFVIKMPYGCGTSHLKKCWNKEGITQKWEESKWCRRIKSLERRKELTDFDRFKLYKTKTKRNRIVGHTFNCLRRAYRHRELCKGKPKAKKAVTA